MTCAKNLLKESQLADSYWFQEGPGVRNWQFQDSGIKLLNVANIEKSGTLNLDKTSRHLSVDEVEAKYSHFLIDAGDLVIASSGISFDVDGMLRTRGAFVNESHLPLCLNTSTIRFKAKPGISDLGYLKHWLDSLEFREEITRRVTGSAQQNFGPSHLKALKISLPPFPEQRRIAAILDQANALRAKRRETLAQLDSLTQSIFIEMFGDPVANPMSWNCRSLDEVTNKVTDGEHLNPTFAESGMPIVMAGNVLVDQIELDVAKKVETALGQQFRKKCGPEFGDLLIVGRGATIGRLCRVNVHDSFCLMGSVILVKPDRSMLDERYLSGMLAMPSMHAMLYKTSGSSAQQAIYLKDVKRLACPMPPLPLQQTFSTRIQAVEALKAVHRTSWAELDTLFASLQHRAFRGEL